jgi:hypothetical protein
VDATQQEPDRAQTETAVVAEEVVAPERHQMNSLSFNVGNRGEPPPITTIQCYNSQSMGHYSSYCTADHVPRGGVQLLQCDVIEEEEEDSEDDDILFSFNMTNNITLTQGHMINQNWILLDTKSTVISFFEQEIPYKYQTFWDQTRARCTQ